MGLAREIGEIPATVPEGGWVWIDVEVTDDDHDELIRLTDQFNLDPTSIRDAIFDVDYPKVDDFAHHLAIVLHGLRDDTPTRVATSEIDCFLMADHLVTIRSTPASSLTDLLKLVCERPGVALMGVDELMATLADLLTRSLLRVLDAFDDRVEDMAQRALSADPNLLDDLVAVRKDLAEIRKVIHPQRETIDMLRHHNSMLLGPASQRKFRDVFDVASRATLELDEARAAVSETLDAYRGAQAGKASEATTVLAVYAAIMLPLTLISGIFGMNFANLPLLNEDWGWIVASAIMSVVAFVSLGVFINLGWVKRPSGRRTGQTLGRGLIEATRAPVHIVGAMFEMSAMPIRKTSAMLHRNNHDDDSSLEPRSDG